MIKYLIILLLLITSFALKAQDQVVEEQPSTTKVEFTSEQLKGFEEQAKNQIMDLTTQINIIAYKSNSYKKKIDAINSAMELFSNEENIVEIQSIKNKGIKYIKKIRDYLNRVKLLSYNNITFTAYDIRITDNLQEGEDGRYYGAAQYCQLFEADVSVKTNEIKTSKHIKDITCRVVQIIVEKKELFGEEVWVVRLGDIRVEDYSYDK